MSKKPKPPKEDDKMAGWLYGWKDIADYLGCTVETTRTYFKRFHLPVQRSPLGKPMCRPQKIDEWVEKKQFLSHSVKI